MNPTSKYKSKLRIISSQIYTMTEEIDKYHKEADYFKCNRLLLIISGLYIPPRSHSILKYALKIYHGYMFMVVYICFIISEIFFLTESQDIYKATDMLMFVAMQISIFAKMTLFITKGREIFDILDQLESFKFGYRRRECLKPGLIIKSAMKRGNLFTLAFYAIVLVALLSVFLKFWYYAVVLVVYGETQDNVVWYTKKPVRSKIPFKHDNPTAYLLVVVYQSWAEFTYGHALAAVDGLFFNVLIYIECHLKIVEESFKTIKVETLEISRDHDDVNDILMKELNATTAHLQTILRYPTLVQFLASAVAVCLCLFVISQTKFGSSEFIYQFVYMVLCYNQLFLFCWFGNKLTFQASKIPDAIWESDWVESTKKFKMCQIFNMHIIQQPFYFSIGKFAPITLNSYLWFVKISYSFYNILIKVAKEE